MPKVLTWISNASIADLTASARSHHPLETGGLIIGYWASQKEAVITRVSVAGPKAGHFRYSYRPDYDYDIEEVRRIYTASRGVETYLGDWHTHPDTNRPYLSLKDIKALHRVANAPDAKAPRPLGMVCAGGPEDWCLKVWVGERAFAAFGRTLLHMIGTSLNGYSHSDVGS